MLTKPKELRVSERMIPGEKDWTPKVYQFVDAKNEDFFKAINEKHQNKERNRRELGLCGMLVASLGVGILSGFALGIDLMMNAVQW